MLNTQRVDKCLRDEQSEARNLHDELVNSMHQCLEIQNETHARLVVLLRERLCSLLDLQDQLAFTLDRWRQSQPRALHKIPGRLLQGTRILLQRYCAMLQHLGERGELGIKCAQLQVRLTALLRSVECSCVLISHQPYQAHLDLFAPDFKPIFTLNTEPIKFQLVNYATGIRVDVRRLDVLEVQHPPPCPINNLEPTNEQLPSSLIPLDSTIEHSASFRAQWQATHTSNDRISFSICLKCTACTTDTCKSDARSPSLLRLQVFANLREEQLQLRTDPFYILHSPTPLEQDIMNKQFLEPLQAHSFLQNTSKMNNEVYVTQCKKHEVRFLQTLNSSLPNQPMANIPFSTEEWLSQASSLIQLTQLSDGLGPCLIPAKRIHLLSEKDAQLCLQKSNISCSYLLRFDQRLLGAITLCYLDDKGFFVQVLFTQSQIEEGLLKEYLQKNNSRLNVELDL